MGATMSSTAVEIMIGKGEGGVRVRDTRKKGGLGNFILYRDLVIGGFYGWRNQGRGGLVRVPYERFKGAALEVVRR
jgi:hypothetical protein